MKLKVVFMGTPEFALPSLQFIYKNFNLIGCFTQPSRPAGRGKKISHSPVKNFCTKNNIPNLTPENFKEEKVIDHFKKMGCDILVVAAYGIILPKTILSVPKFGALNVHASLLPRWRGAAPIQRAILAGDQETGISIMQMNEKLDAGSIIIQEKIVIKENNTSQEIHDKLANIGGKLMSKYTVAIVGVTGIVGSEVLKILGERGFPIKDLKLLASSRSEGTEIPFQGE